MQSRVSAQRLYGGDGCVAMRTADGDGSRVLSRCVVVVGQVFARRVRRSWRRRSCRTCVWKVQVSVAEVKVRCVA